MVVLLAVAALLILVNGLFVLVEFALVRVRSSKIELLARKGSARALRVQDILGNLDEYLAACQVGITVVSLALGWIGEPSLAALIRTAIERAGIPLSSEASHALAFCGGLAGLSWLHIVLGELVPRTIGIQKAETVALWGAYPLKVFALIFRPPVAFTAWSSMGFLRLLGFKSAAMSETTVSEDELRVLFGENQEKAGLPLERLLLFENLLDLSGTKASEIMIPRDRIAFLSLKKSWDENLETIRARRYSRYPLCEDGLDTVLGFVHVKDMLLKTDLGSKPDLKGARRELAEVSESEPLEKLIKLFPDKGIHMALVRDPKGSIVGLVTLEDIVEELIGEVQDEFDLQRAWSLAELIVPAAVLVGLHAADRREAIEQLVAKLASAVPELDRDEVLHTVWERELKLSSGVGLGVAVPHGRLAKLERPLIAIGRFAKPLPFPSPDNAPVRLLFLILTPASQPVLQLKILGRIASIMTNENLRRRLLRAKSTDSLLDTLRTADTVLAS